MDVTDTVNKIEASPEFKEFSKEHTEAYLAHIFSMHEQPGAFSLQIGYFSPKSDKMTVFETEPLKRLPDDETFKKEGTVAQLDLEKVKVSMAEAEEKALLFQREKYSAELVTKIIIVLQHLDAQVYNFTLVTKNFNILNIRLDATSGEVASHEMRSIMSLRQSDEE
ncbi:hypothetical protein GOV07_05490 [Candidatus Woesearchaeota archaeon]|nr:hypothetical protein [Candidatus Woesearchaeota archaeon]